MNGEAVVDPVALRDSTETCARCGRLISRLEQPFVLADQIVCFGCHRHAQESEHADSSAAAEHIFLHDTRIQVTRSHIRTARSSVNLDDVRCARVAKVPVHRLLPVLLVLLGVATVALGFNRDLDQWDRISLVIGFPILATGLLLGALIHPKHLVLLSVHDQEQAILVSRRGRYAKLVVDAIAQALVERGQSPRPLNKRLGGARVGRTPSKQEQLAG